MTLEKRHIGRYQFVSLIGRGGMGEVYQAQDTRLRRTVAIKIISRETPLGADQDKIAEASRLFLREARAIAQLNHPLIVPVYDFGEAPVDGQDLSYMVMPFYPDGPFTQWLRLRLNDGALHWDEVNHFIGQAADALQYAHQHDITHRDIKPANFLIRPASSPQHLPDLLLSDFGIARFLTETIHESHNSRGTTAYMAPEQWRGEAVPASDQYALAVLAYEILTGQLPFRGHPEQLLYQHIYTVPQLPTQLNPRLPAAVDEVLLHALAKKPEERFVSMKAFAHELTRALHSPPDQPAPPLVRPSTPVLSSGGADPASPGSLALMLQATEYHPKPAGQAPLSACMPPTPITDSAQTPGLYSSAPPPPARSGLVLLLVLLMIAGSIGGAIVYFSHLSSPTSSRASSSQTVTVSHGSTSTPGTSPTATPTNPYPPHSGTVVINDPLSDNSQGHDWNDLMASTYACSFSNGAYHALQTLKDWFTTCFAEHAGLVLRNFTFQVQMSIVNGDCGGLAFRGNPTEVAFYFFRACVDGTYDLRLFTDNTNQGARTLISQKSTSALIPGLNVTNTLAVVAQNAQLTLYINQQKVATINDTSYASGKIAVVASSLSNPTQAAFTNAIVWQQER